jgi:signal peptide peptidase SppA
MNVLDVLNAPWAITVEGLQQIHEIYRARMEGRESAWLEELRAADALAPGGRRASEAPYEVIDGVAVIPVQGPIAQRMNLFSSISGGTSSQLLKAAVEQAAEDPMVEGIVLNIDSPGGSVAGTPEAAAAIKAVRGIKPIEAWTDGMIASAAYWMASATERISISSSVTHVGSIGVVATHVDQSGAEEQRGIKTTEIYAGKYKRIASSYAPLSDAGRSHLQERVDYLYSVFVGQVADNRAASIETVLTKMADGRLFVGTQAIDAGLADGVASLSEVIASVRNRAAESRATTQREQFHMLTAESVRKDHPDVARELETAAAVAATNAERARILAIQTSALPGHDALVASLIESGASAGDAALQIMAAERARMSAAGAARAQDAAANPPVKPAVPSQESKPELSREEMAAKASTHAAEKGIEFVAAFEELFPGVR